MQLNADAVASSFKFHEELESPLDFLRREWRAVVLFGGGFTAIMVAVVLLIDQSFFYPRLQTDALLYYLKAKSLAESGTTAARLALNLAPFPYASMPGILRAPFVAAFSDFDDQLRAIQLSNILTVDVAALLAAYILSWAVPKRLHWMTIGFSFAFVLLAPWWIGNVFMPMVDAPFTAFSLLSVVVAIRGIASPRPLLRPLPLILFAVLFGIAFLLRYTEPVVLILVAVLLKGKFRDRAIDWKPAAFVSVVTGVVLGLLVYLNRDAIFGRYLAEPIGLLLSGDKESTILNFFFLAVPEQIIPGFGLGFAHPPLINLYSASFAASRADALWSAFGAAITAVVIWGAWRVRGRMLPELLMILGVLPVLVAIMPSTSRYFMTYQPFFWIAFLEGARAIAERIPAATRRALPSRAKTLGTVGCFIILAVGIQASESPRLLLSRGSRFMELMSLPHYVRGVSDTYRPLRRFLQTLPPDRTLLTSSKTTWGRWKAIANLDSYAPDSNLVAVAAKKGVYLVVECGAADLCAVEDRRESMMKDALCRVGEFNYELVFSAKAAKSEAKVYRVRPAT
jgi:hypothetical protein